LHEALLTASDIYETRLRHQSSWIAMIFPLLAYLGIGLAVGLIVLAIMLPLLSLIQNLGL
jgi:type II secretory pathway component PulF